MCRLVKELRPRVQPVGTDTADLLYNLLVYFKNGTLPTCMVVLGKYLTSQQTLLYVSMQARTQQVQTV